MPQLISKLEIRPKTLRHQILERLKVIQSQIDDMKQSVNDDLNNRELKEEDMFRINEKMKELENNILRVIEG